MRGLAALAFAAACTPRHGSAFFAYQDVLPRQLLWTAMDATHELHYDVVAIDSADTAVAFGASSTSERRCP